MTALRYPVGSASHRPHRFNGSLPEVTDVFMLNGKGWHSPELTVLCRDFGRGLVVQACDELNLDPRRQNIAALREHLEAIEGRMQ